MSGFRSVLKRVLWMGVLGVLAAALWTAWPLYGWYSQNNEAWRLPFGWTALPAEAPIDRDLRDPAYADAAARAEQALAAKRAEILAPALSAAVAVEGRLVWAAAQGWADIEAGRAVSTQTLFRIGSTSKAVTATILARLVDAGVMELDAPLSRYRETWPNPAWDALTPRQLASHTAGIVGYKENEDGWGLYHSLALRDHYDDVAQSLEVFDGAPLLFEPGTDFHYSTYDTVLLSAAMQAAAGVPYAALLEGRVLSPLDLSHTEPGERADLRDRTAQFYQRKEDRFKPWRKVDLSHRLAGGGLLSTPSDLVMIGGAWLDDAFVRPETREDFWTPVRLANGEVNEQDYAVGWRRKTVRVEGVGEIVNLNHGGVSKGAQCWLMVVPEHDMAIALSINIRTDPFFRFASVFRDILAAFVAVSGEASDGAPETDL